MIIQKQHTHYRTNCSYQIAYMSKKKESKKLVHMHDEYELFCKMVTSPAEFDMYVWNSLVFDMSLR